MFPMLLVLLLLSLSAFPTLFCCLFVCATFDFNLAIPLDQALCSLPPPPATHLVLLRLLRFAYFTCCLLSLPPSGSRSLNTSFPSSSCPKKTHCTFRMCLPSGWLLRYSVSSTWSMHLPHSSCCFLLPLPAHFNELMRVF